MSRVSTSLTGVAKKAEQQFSEAAIPSPRLDTEVLLAYALDVTRSWLHAHGDEELRPEIIEKFEQFVERRLKREPVAYITGTKEFYGRDFIVTPDVLIPRPETEELIELALKTLGGVSEASEPRTPPVIHLQPESDLAETVSDPARSRGAEGRARRAKTRIIDVGCGSGCIGITLKLENPKIDVTLADISPAALEVARQNAAALGAEVVIVKSDLLMSFKDSSFDVLIANLPYVDRSWETSPETAHEPKLALYAEDSGLALIYKLIGQCESILRNKGLLLLEADPEQHSRIIKEARKHGFEPLEIRGYALCFTKLSQA